MTITLKTYTNASYHIEIAQDKYSSNYKVELCQCYGNGLCSAPIKKNTYTTITKANARFNRLKAEYIG